MRWILACMKFTLWTTYASTHTHKIFMQIMLCSNLCSFLSASLNNPEKHSFNWCNTSFLLLFSQVPVVPYRGSFSSSLQSIVFPPDEQKRLFYIWVECDCNSTGKQKSDHKSLYQRQIQISSYFWSRQKAKPRIREAICMCLRESCLYKWGFSPNNEVNFLMAFRGWWKCNGQTTKLLNCFSNTLR